MPGPAWSLLAADNGTEEHDLVVIVLGTEDSIERGRVSGLLARYALQTFRTGGEEPEEGQLPGRPFLCQHMRRRR